MGKADLGKKRLCANCGAKYYDLNRTPIVCPRCGTQFEVPHAKAKPQAAAAPKAVEDEADKADPEAVEVISLEEADEETKGGAKASDDDDDDLDVDVDDDDEADDSFLETEDDEDDDVADIIGDVDEKPET